jgi:hypothetical protein
LDRTNWRLLKRSEGLCDRAEIGQQGSPARDRASYHTAYPGIKAC